MGPDGWRYFKLEYVLILWLGIILGLARWCLCSRCEKKIRRNPKRNQSPSSVSSIKAPFVSRAAHLVLCVGFISSVLTPSVCLSVCYSILCGQWTLLLLSARGIVQDTPGFPSIRTSTLPFFFKTMLSCKLWQIGMTSPSHWMINDHALFVYLIVNASLQKNFS